MIEMTVCEACGYPYHTWINSLPGCDNPACLENPRLSDDRKAQMVEAYQLRKQEQEERAMLQRARESAYRSRA